jgi:pimeloyl-ACP methyl ester carboxylesterase
MFETQRLAPGTLVSMARKVHGRDPSFRAHASSYERLLAQHELDATASLIDVPTPEGGSLPTFVLETGSGAPVLFLHGSPATSLVWVPLLAKLPGVRAIAIDRPGHGLSGAIDYADVPDIRAHTVAYIDALLDAMGLEQVALAGNSFGGLCGLWYSLARPERVSSVLQLGAPPGMLSRRTPMIFGLLSVPWIARLFATVDPPSVRSTRRFFRMMGDPPEQLDPTFMEAYTTSQQLPTVEGGISRLVQRGCRFPGSFRERSMWLDEQELARVRQPTLFVWGPKDFVGAPDFGRRVAGAMPKAQLVVKGVGHLPWLQDPAGVAAASTEFLSAA